MNLKSIAKLSKFKTLFLLVCLTFSLGLTGCPDENENLVNPPSSSASVLSRVINLAGDKSPRELKFDDYTFGEIRYLSVSNAVSPPSDSVDLEIYKNNNLEFTQFRKQRFTRNLRYTHFILPSGAKDTTQRVVDTVISVATSIVALSENNQSNIRLFNAIGDSNSSYNLKLGCQNGLSLATSVQYRSASAYSHVFSGINSFSVTKSTNNGEVSLGTYEINLIDKLEYMIVVAKDFDNKEVVYLLDEYGRNTNSFEKLTPLTQTETQFRMINLSNTDISISDSETNIFNDINPNSITNYKNVGACKGSSLDKFTITNPTGQSESFFTTLELNQKYTSIIYDKLEDNQSKIKALNVPQFKLFETWNGKSIIRVVNLYNSEKTLTISAGTRTDNSVKSLNYRSGEIFESAVPFEAIGGVKITQSGYLPITVFSNSQPIDYITGVVENIEPNKSYLLVITGKDGETPKISLIDDYYDGNAVSRTIQNSEEGVFYQIVNATSELEFINTNLGDIITNANLYSGTNISGVVKAGNYQITLGSKTETFNFTKDSRPLLIACGDKNNQEIIDATTNKYILGNKEIRRRFVNAAIDVDGLSVYQNNTGTDVLPEITGLGYKAISSYKIETNDNKFTLYFKNTNTLDSLSRVTDVKLSYKKGYTLIYTGTKNPSNVSNGYNLIIQQEF
jgi:hypothetical protein